MVGYRPFLDGVRSLAVYLVVLFHAGVGRAAGGFIGVDVFFVLSGYLVTQVLLRDLDGLGGVRFGRFYARRFRRLLPASFVVLVSTLVVFGWVAGPAEVAQAAGGFRAAFLYSANWYFVREATDYFAGGQAESPVLHFWSLAVEEQFYVVWPLVLAGLTWVAGRFGVWGRNVLRGLVLVLGLVSFGWAWHLSVVAPDRAYYGTDTRIYQLLAGALLALTPAVVVRWRRVDWLAGPVALVALVGLVVLATDVVSVRPVGRGVVAAVLTVVLVVGLERGPGVVRSVFSWRPVVELGRISYGTYLWHWPVIVIVGRLGDFGAWQVAVLSVVVSTGLAAGSALLELPLRESVTLDRVPRVVVAAGLSVSLLGGLVLVDRVPGWWPGSGGSGEGTEVASGVGDLVLARVPADFDQLAIYDERYYVPTECSHKTPAVCTVVEGTGPHVVLVGDSNAVMLQGAMVEMARQQNLTLTLAAFNGCPWEPGLLQPGRVETTELCAKVDALFYGEILGKVKPDVVIAFNVQNVESIEHSAFTGAPDQVQQREAIASGARQIIESGAALVVIETLPRSGGPNPLNCLGTATYQEECRFEAPGQDYWVDGDLRALDAAEERMWSVDLDRVVCPALPICDPIVDGTVVRWDGAHLTRRFGMTLVDDLTQMLADRGLLGG
jgi:peptidoglycan/LPS O-acetylase OafA/YrhL